MIQILKLTSMKLKYNINKTYTLSFFGVHGSGKTTMKNLLVESLDFNVPRKNGMGVNRMINYKNLLLFLNNYMFQNKNLSKVKNNITSRCGLIDVLVYSEALNKIGYISNNEKTRIINFIEKNIDKFILPKYLINMKASPEILLNRLQSRNRFQHNINKIQAIYSEYELNFEFDIFSNHLLKEIITFYKNKQKLFVVDTSFHSKEEVLFQILSEIKGLNSTSPSYFPAPHKLSRSPGR